MKSQFQLISILIILFLTVLSGVAEESTSIEFQIIDIKEFELYKTTSNKASFKINSVVQVYNPSSENITFSHSDSCGFKTNTTYYEHNEWDSNFIDACFQAITPHIFSPGITNSSANGWINFDDKTITQIPDGRYSITMDFADPQSTNKVMDFGFIVVDGEITSKYINFTRWGTIEVPSETSLLLFTWFSSFIPIVIFILLNTKCFRKRISY